MPPTNMDSLRDNAESDYSSSYAREPINLVHSPTVIQFLSPYHGDDEYSLTDASSIRRSEYVRSPEPLLRPDERESETVPLTEPPPLAAPPPYRQNTLPPPYKPRADKYQALPDDLEAADTKQPRFYGWRIWLIVVIVVVATIVSIGLGLSASLQSLSSKGS